MEDPLAPLRGVLYQRCAHWDDPGPRDLFTRPALLALRDEGLLPAPGHETPRRGFGRIISRACRLLLDGRTAGESPGTRFELISQTALSCGFEDEKEFIRIFRDSTGLSPEEWLKCCEI